MSSLQNCYSEDLFTAQWSFLLFFASFLSLLLLYKKVRNLQKMCKSTVTASDYVTQKQLLEQVNIKHTPIYMFWHVRFITCVFHLEQIDFDFNL